MYRLVFALLVGLVLSLGVSGFVAGQEKAEKAPPPQAADGGIGHVVIDGTHGPIYTVSYRLSFPEMVFAFLVLFAMTMIFFQLLLVRSTLEKILERQGGTP